MPEYSEPGHYPIQFGNTNKDYLEKVFIPLNFRLFGIETKIEHYEDKRNINSNWKKLYLVRFKSKKVYMFLNKKCEIPTGKKSNSIKIPDLIKSSTTENKKNFLAWFFDTDGGLQGGAFGFHIASKQLRDEITLLLRNLGFEPTVRNCFNGNQNKTYFQLSLTKKETKKLLTTIRLRNKAKAAALSKAAGVAERPNVQITVD